MSENKTLINKGYKFRFYPNKEQEIYLSKVFGCGRFIYNYFLAENKKAMELHKESPNTITKPSFKFEELCSKLPFLKKEEDKLWLAEVPALTLQQSVRQFSTALTNAVKSKKGFPKFKNKNGRQSVTFTTFGYKLDGNKLTLAKCEKPLEIKLHRSLPKNSTLGNISISKDPSGKYYVSFNCKYEISEDDKTDGKGILGLDAGITNLYSLSDGTFIDNPKSFVNGQNKLAKVQRLHARKKKGSKNKEKSRIKVAKLHERIANIRKDYLHKLSTKLVSENQALAIEDLQVSNMSRNRKLAKHVMDAGWGMFRRFLEYKVHESQHCTLAIANTFFPSTQSCSSCGKRHIEKIKLGVKKWTCYYCSAEHHRDTNAAMNLELIAHKLLSKHTYVETAGKIHLTDKYILQY